MANNVMFNVGPNFNMDFFAKQLVDMYRAKGYAVNPVNLAGNYSITFEKGVGGINTLLGMGEGVKANITQTGNTVNISFTDEEWTGKIIAIAVGWFLCWVPMITGIIGVVRQLGLPKSIGNDAQSIAASM